MNIPRLFAKRTLIALSITGVLLGPLATIVVPALVERGGAQEMIPNGGGGEGASERMANGFNTPGYGSHETDSSLLSDWHTCVATYETRTLSQAELQDMRSAGVDTSLVESFGVQARVPVITLSPGSIGSPPSTRIVNGGFRNENQNTCNEISPMIPTMSGETRIWQGKQFTATNTTFGGGTRTYRATITFAPALYFEDDDLTMGTFTLYDFDAACQFHDTDIGERTGPPQGPGGGQARRTLEAYMLGCNRAYASFHVNGAPEMERRASTNLTFSPATWNDAATITVERSSGQFTEVYKKLTWSDTPVITPDTERPEPCPPGPSGDACRAQGQRSPTGDPWSLYFLWETDIGQREAMTWNGGRGCENPLQEVNGAYHPIDDCFVGNTPHCVPFIAVPQGIGLTFVDGRPDVAGFNNRVQALGGTDAWYYDYRLDDGDCSYRGHSRPTSIDNPGDRNSRIWFYRSDEHQALATVFPMEPQGQNGVSYSGIYAHQGSDGSAEIYDGPSGDCVGRAGVFEASSGGNTGPHGTTWNFYSGCNPRQQAPGSASVFTLGGSAGEAGFAHVTSLPSFTEPVEDEFHRVGCSWFENALSWIICPFVLAATGAIEWLDSAINTMLTVDEGRIFDDDRASGAGYHRAWAVFRNFALAILVIAALVMVIAQAAGIEILDAYTIRKILPRLLLATIGITFSWQLAHLGVVISNELGQGIRGIIYMPFSGQGGPLESLDVGTNFVILLLTTGAILAMGIIAMLTFIVTGLIAVLIAFALLTFREIAIIALILVAPIAIACAILPNTQKVWVLWRKSFILLLAAYLIIMAFIAVGRVFSATAVSAGDDGGVQGSLTQIIGIVAYFAPYFMIPFIFKMTGGLMGAVGNFANQGFKRLNTPLQGWRKERGKQHRQETMTGKNWLGSMAGGSVGRGFHRLGNVNRGGMSMTRKGRARYKDIVQAEAQARAVEGLKQDNGRAAGNDDANEIAMTGVGRNEFLKQYAAKVEGALIKEHGAEMGKRKAMEQAHEALATFENGFGARMGSDDAQVVAAKAWYASNTSGAKFDDKFDFNKSTQLAVSQLGRLVASGKMSVSDAASVLKSNNARGDRSSIGFNAAMGAISTAAQRAQPGQAGDLLQNDEVEALKREALDGTNANTMMHGRHEQISLMAPEMRKKIQEVAARHTAATAEWERAASANDQIAAAEAEKEIAKASKEYGEALAQVANFQDAMASTHNVSGQKAADELLGHAIGAEGSPSIRTAVEDARTNPSSPYYEAFQNRRRELTAAAREAGAVGGGASTDAPAPGAVVGPKV